ncbi:LysM peptidoglycan-binding domain-containing protein [Oceanobacillus profundus]|uniref:LysM peptidoglycan-binding domain-containing protein n=1 Tax=Oceanobacillus profundus TaxID=372463 RepID=A0A417YN80_9BACI|nr:LysM peptidoglycan-binding domain-containing protein [Oceanobacillus profundus]MDO6447872.1 LysM peptidoglycan-binding domain-containing protein [Oceanobacillus profundus]RHW35058.1 LysM peptidoglycan-binding domain-containing protein [Oceanobacillus profundus]
MKYLTLITLVTLGLILFTNEVHASSQYTVQSGDVLSEISRNHNVSVDSLLEFNTFLSDPDIIYAGQTLTIPDAKGETFTVTAYTAGYESTGKEHGDPGYGITASGTEVQEGQTIACPDSLSFGTKLYIPYFDKTFTCEDRGSAVTEGRLDVYMEDLDEALEFGVKDLQVHY